MQVFFLKEHTVNNYMPDFQYHLKLFTKLYVIFACFILFVKTIA